MRSDDSHMDGRILDAGDGAAGRRPGIGIGIGTGIGVGIGIGIGVGIGIGIGVGQLAG